LPDFLQGLHEIKLKKTSKAKLPGSASKTNTSGDDNGVAPGAKLLGTAGL
jgi:hypothetical protein